MILQDLQKSKAAEAVDLYFLVVSTTGFGHSILQLSVDKLALAHFFFGDILGFAFKNQ